MAIYHCSVKNISRSNGRSAVGSSAYRSAEKLHNEYDGMTHDYTKKSGVVHSEVMLCKNAPRQYQDRAKLWNAVEEIEKSKNARLAREVEVALPKEFSREQQIEVVREYVKENFVDRGMCADVSIHDKGDGNPHAHIMLTTRPISENGDWGAKSKKAYVLGDNGERIKLSNGQWKSYKVDLVDWNERERVEEWREQWAKTCNQEFKRAGIEEQIDHRSYAEQGILQEPMIHLGPIAAQMERRGEQSDRGNHNREVRESNMFLAKDVEELQDQVTMLVLENKRMKAELEEREKVEEEKKKEIEEREKERAREREQIEEQGIEHGGLRDIEFEGRERDIELDEQKEEIDLSYEGDIERMGQLQSEYIGIEFEIAKQKQNIGGLNQERQKLLDESQSIVDGVKNINQWDRKIVELESQKASLGMFDFKAKKELEKQIVSVEKSKEQAINSFIDRYGIQPKDAKEKLETINYRYQKVKVELEKKVDITGLEQKKDKIVQEYKKEKILLEVNGSNGEKETSKAKEFNNIQDKLIYQKAVDRLNKLSPADYQKVAKELPAHLQQKVVERGTAKEMQKAQKMNIQSRSR